VNWLARDTKGVMRRVRCRNGGFHEGEGIQGLAGRQVCQVSRVCHALLFPPPAAT